MKHLLLLAALTTTALAKPFLGSYFGFGEEKEPTLVDQLRPWLGGPCSVLFGDVADWFSICPQQDDKDDDDDDDNDDDEDEDDDSLLGLGIKVPLMDITLRAGGSSEVP